IVGLILYIIASRISASASNLGRELVQGTLFPDQFKVQFAGNVGVVSAGFGYNTFGGKMTSMLMLGYAPKFISNADIVTVIQKNTFRGRNFKISKLQRIYPIAGFSINIETGRNSFLTLPDDYPEGYYGTNAITYAIFTGLTFQGKINHKTFVKQLEYYCEIGTLGTYVYYNIMRKEYLNPDILSLALGVNIKLN
ncbi:MAG: hypothetical protein JEZ09_14160, partial [Salinivirgaceae bacterium]|nr:hypothetical protein [Salinivirgaceae bacterium]